MWLIYGPIMWHLPPLDLCSVAGGPECRNKRHTGHLLSQEESIGHLSVVGAGNVATPNYDKWPGCSGIRWLLIR